MPIKDLPDPFQINLALVQRLVTEQFPEYSDLPIRAVDNSGWNNCMFHLGDNVVVRLPRASYYSSALEKEQQWLPKIADHLPLAVPKLIGSGKASVDFPSSWSIHNWIDGDVASSDSIADMNSFAEELAQFLISLQKMDLSEGPTPNKWNGRGGPVSAWDSAVRHAIEDLDGRIDTDAVTQIWDNAMTAELNQKPVWVHGDVAAGNLLVKDGHLSAVIDFGLLVFGDPACDLAIAWTLLDAQSRDVFRSTLKVDDGTWARGQGWALWKALIVLAKHTETNQIETRVAPRVITELVEDHLFSKN